MRVRAATLLRRVAVLARRARVLVDLSTLLVVKVSATVDRSRFLRRTRPAKGRTVDAWPSALEMFGTEIAVMLPFGAATRCSARREWLLWVEATWSQYLQVAHLE